MGKGAATSNPPVNKLPEDTERDNRSNGRNSCFSQWIGGENKEFKVTHKVKSSRRIPVGWVGGSFL